MKGILLSFSLAGLCACGGISFQKPMGIEEFSTRREIGSYYDDMKAAFAAQNPESLAKLFYPGIAKPMTFPQILAWARKFFGENQAIRFHIDKMVFEDIGPGRAVVRLTYHVTTALGKGDFGATEVDVVEKHGGWWVIVSWEKAQ